jgi:hypothetical protein
LRLATGQVVELPVYGNGLSPRLGARYLISLTAWQEAFSIAEGYEILDGLVFPLRHMKPRPPETEMQCRLALNDALAKIR